MFSKVLFAAAVALAPLSVHAATIFEDTPNETPGGLDIAIAAGSGAVGNSDPFVGSVFGSPGVGFAISGLENFDITVAGGGVMSALSFEVYEPTTTQTLGGCNTSCFDSTFQYTAYLNGAIVGGNTFLPTDDAVSSVAISGFLFDRVEVRETVGTNDNEFFANFSATLAPVPLPAGALLLLTGLGALALRKRA